MRLTDLPPHNMWVVYAAPLDQGNAFADLELGYPVTGNAANGTSLGAFRGTDVAGYIQDDWKMLPKLTLNLGVRYDFDNPPVDKNGHGALYNLATNTNIPGTWNTNAGQYGTTRSGPRQPHLVDTNLGLMKNFAITEHQQLQFRAEAFDVFNHPTLGVNTPTLVSAPNAGLVTYEATGPRVMQFALRYSF